MTAKLSKDLLNELKAQLEEKKTDLVNEIKLLKEEDSFKDPSRTVGNSEEADEAYEETSHLEVKLKQGVAEESLGLVTKALARIVDGSYGTCEVGGEDIAVARLKAMPEADNCIEHEKKEEAQEETEEAIE
jgi:DnaK suppressor protein